MNRTRSRTPSRWAWSERRDVPLRGSPTAPLARSPRRLSTRGVTLQRGTDRSGPTPRGVRAERQCPHGRYDPAEARQVSAAGATPGGLHKAPRAPARPLDLLAGWFAKANWTRSSTARTAAALDVRAG